MREPRIEIKALSATRWPDLEKLFGLRGACGGCWCMYWRQERGEPWDKLKGEANKLRFKKLVKSGKANGAIAYVAGEPVGWVSFDRRADFAKLDRAPSFQCADADRVWSIPCFFIKSGFRGKGVAGALLRFAVGALKRRGARVIEGYPVKSKSGAIPAAFAWTGTTSLFLKQGFAPVGKRDGGKQRMRILAL